MCSETLSSAPALSAAGAALLSSLPKTENNELAEQAAQACSALSGSALGLKEWFLPIYEQKPWQPFFLPWTTGFTGACDHVTNVTHPCPQASVSYIPESNFLIHTFHACNFSDQGRRGCLG